VYGGYANIYTDPSSIPDALWMNSGNDNHFFGLNLQGIQSNRSAVGAKVKVYSPLGIQLREVRAGESYGIMNSMQIHFGMGGQPIVDSIAVYWPSGIVDRLYNLPVDQYVNLQEGGCLTPAIQIEALGATTFCTGDSVALTAPAGYSYAWNTGDTTALIHVFSAGTYRVTVTAPNGCSAVSNQIATFTDPVEIPTIAVEGDSIFCAGGSAVLTASAAQSYLWSNGSAEQSILITASGQYRVTAQGLCGFFESAPVTITVLDPDVPQVMPDTTWLHGNALLTAVGDSILWFDAPGGNLLAGGESLLTPPLDSSTTYWAQNLLLLDEPNVFAGPVSHQGTIQAGNQFNGALIFDCLRPFRLSTVKVYALLAGQRKIDLIQNGVVIQTKTLNIPIGISNIALNFDIPVGDDLQLSTDGAVNQANLGTLSPQLRRSDQGVSYPYVIPDVLSIKNSNFGTDRYYYFYNWQVDFYETACYSAPVPVQAVVDATIIHTTGPNDEVAVSLFPNPTTGVFFLNFPTALDQTGYLRMTDTRGRQLIGLDTPGAAQDGSYRLNLLGQPAGIYFLEWRGRTGVWRGKVILKK
ncbi:MAG: ASPIC/UnbV domain-containing protein, partial [Saprospiraceae bacterium]